MNDACILLNMLYLGTIASCLLVVAGGGQSFAKNPDSKSSPDKFCALRKPTSEVWGLAAEPRSYEYCARLVQAQIRLSLAPAVAEKLARAALAIEPHGKRAKLLIAQALLFQGKFLQSHEVFESVSMQDVLGDSAEKRFPRFSLAAARAALLTHHYSIALTHYRRTALLADRLVSEHEQARLFVETAVAASYSGKGNGREARGYLRLAKGLNAPLLEEVIDASWALSLWRDNRLAEAKSAVAKLKDSWKIVWIFRSPGRARGRADESLPVLPRGESFALAGVVAEATEPKLASIHWLDFIEEGAGSTPPHLRISGGNFDE